MPLGWTCIRSTKSKELRVYHSNFVRTYNASAVGLKESNTKLKKILEIHDVLYKNKGVFSEQEIVASTVAFKSLKFKNGKYYNNTFKRLENIEKRLLKQLEFGAKHCKVIEHYISKGYLEYVDTKEGKDNGWFLSHFPIFSPKNWQQK